MVEDLTESENRLLQNSHIRMPLPKRSIEPVYVSRSVYQQDELQLVELETVTNTTLTNIIRQLSSLSKHAEDIFGELARDVGNISNRANSLQARIDHLSIKVTQLDSSIEDVPLTDITRKKGFKSAKAFDQKIFSHSTMPAPMLETYSMCDKPPPLNKLNNYRDDGKDGLKFYTDPNYFFELWRQEMLKDTERVMHDRGKKLNRPRQDSSNGCISTTGSKKRVRKPHNTREKQRLIAIGHGETLMPNNISYQTPNSIINMESGYGSVGVYDTRQLRPNSIELQHSINSEQAVSGFYSPLPQVVAAVTSNVAVDGFGAQHNSTLGKSENGMVAIQQMQISPQALQMQNFYDEEVFNENHACCDQSGQEAMPSEGICAPGTISRMKTRPSQPPPAPPSNGSRSGTPVSSNANTPTRNRNTSNNRDTLPPPPPIPEGIMNPTSPSRIASAINGSTGHNNAKLSTCISNTSLCGPLQLPPNINIRDTKALILSQLDNSFNNINMNNASQHPNYRMDLPFQAQSAHQHTTISTAKVAPPPPPPPPPAVQNESVKQCQQSSELELKSVLNGDIHSRIIIDETTQHIVGQKRLLPPFYDSRTDLMKAIRDGITLRKVEKSEQKEIERNTALHDVASILARRVAIELSESEESDTDDDSEGWMESIEIST